MELIEEEESNQMGSSATSTRKEPRRLLFSYGSSLLAIADVTYRRFEEMNGPLGSLARRVASAASPILHPLLLQWLSILSFFDDLVSKFENIAVSIFPPSTIVFAKIDELALLADSLPKVFDDGVNDLLVFLHQLPMIDFAMEKLGLMSAPSDKSDDVMVDIKCDGRQTEGSTREGEERVAKMRMEEETREAERSRKEVVEALEIVEVVGDRSERGGGGGKKKEKVGGGDDEGKGEVVKDSILELFDEGWHLRSV